jgi:hypothetical protein
MTTNTKIVLGLVVVVVVLVLGFLYSSTHTFGATTPSTSTAGYFTESFGGPLVVLGNAITGINSTGAAGYVGNIQIQGVRQNIVAATTTPCAMQNPFSASSTLLNATMNVTTATTTTGQITFASSANAFATTTLLIGASLTSGAQGSFMAGETSSSTGLGVIVAPSGWIVIGVQGAAFPFTYGGTCSAIFQSM